jgi:hypothetical protein
MKRLVLATIGLLLMTAGVCFAQSDQPSLADLAKSRHSTKKSVRVITNDDIATVYPQSGSEPVAAKGTPAAGDSTPAAGATAKPADKKDSAQNSSANSKDSAAVAGLKKQLDSYKQEQEGWKRSAKRYEDLLANETDSFRRQMYQDALDSDKRNVAAFQEKIDQTQADLAKAQK